MLWDAYGKIGTSGFSQPITYKANYNSENKDWYDRWHTSPDQLVNMLPQDLGFTKTEKNSPDQDAITRLMTEMKNRLDARTPMLILLSYDDLARQSPTKRYASGTHLDAGLGGHDHRLGVAGRPDVLPPLLGATVVRNWPTILRLGGLPQWIQTRRAKPPIDTPCLGATGHWHTPKNAQRPLRAMA